MENLIDLGLIEKNTRLFKGRIFTEMQLDILKKRLKKKSLNNNEKTYYYKFIKPKIRAMMAFFNISEIDIQGREFIIENRIKYAIKILGKLERKHKNKKILLTGSFLFNKKEDYQSNKIHVTFLPESTLESLFYNSISQISISNFKHAKKKDFNIALNDILQTYELLINAILNKEDHLKNLRNFILQTEYASKGIILNPKQLYKIKEKLMHNNLDILSNTFINSLILGYNKRILKQKLKIQINDYKKLSKEYKTANNLSIYIDTYSKVISLAT